MNKSFILLAFSCMVGLSSLYSQDNVKNSSGANTIFFELFGPGMAVSINYDRRLDRSNHGHGFRIGFSGYATDYASFLALPIGYNYLFGKNRSFFEIGINYVYCSKGFYPLSSSIESDERTKNNFGMFTFAYRRQPTDSGFNFRIGANPAFGFYKSGDFYFWPYFIGVSFGYTF